MWILRLLGFLLIIICCGGAGMKRAARLKRRVKTLIETEFAIEAVAVYIKMSSSDIATILSLTLPLGMSYDGAGLVAENFLCLERDDRDIINAFLSDLGMSDTDSQLNRCSAFKELISAQRKKAQQEVEEKYKLFLICGWLTGIILSLFWW